MLKLSRKQIDSIYKKEKDGCFRTTIYYEAIIKKFPNGVILNKSAIRWLYDFITVQEDPFQRNWRVEDLCDLVLAQVEEFLSRRKVNKLFIRLPHNKRESFEEYYKSVKEVLKLIETKYNRRIKK